MLADTDRHWLRPIMSDYDARAMNEGGGAGARDIPIMGQLWLEGGGG